jgi:cholesterol transport system auxiliary component
MLTALFVVNFASLTGCTLPTATARPASYDFGVSHWHPAPNSAQTLPTLAPLILSAIEAPPALDSTAMHYRLAYAHPQQLRPYAQARWRMAPAQLLRQRLRERLGESHTLLNAGDPLPTAPSALNTPLRLRLELEEFSQWFDAPDQSSGLLRLHATLSQASATGEQLIAQRRFTLQRPAPTPDAPGGVHALAEASEAAAHALEAWVAGVAK